MMNRPRVDIKAVVDVLSRRTAERIEHERQRGFMLDLTYSDFRARDMRGLHLERASFSYANLTNAYFIYARLERALFRFTELNGADLSGAKLNHADLTAAELQEANLERSQLEGANLRLASLTEANLKSANLNTANLAHARLTRANLRSVNLASVRNLRQQQIDLAFGDCDTVLPDGIDVPHHWAEEPWNSYLPDAKYKAWLEARAPAGKPRADRA